MGSISEGFVDFLVFFFFFLVYVFLFNGHWVLLASVMVGYEAEVLDSIYSCSLSVYIENLSKRYCN